MTETTVLASGLAMGESPRWHDDRLWVCDWMAGEVSCVIMLRFGLDEHVSDELVTAATQAEQQAVDLYRFTSLLNRLLDDGTVEEARVVARVELRRS